MLLAADTAYELQLPTLQPNTESDNDGDGVANSVEEYLLNTFRPTFVFDEVETNPGSPSEQYFVSVEEFLFRSNMVQGPYENPGMQTVLDGRTNPTIALQLWRDHKNDTYPPHLRVIDTTPQPLDIQQT
jgi:hypothetical protein